MTSSITAVGTLDEPDQSTNAACAYCRLYIVGSSTLFIMNHYDLKRLALVLAVQAEIEGMKAANSQHPENQPYTKEQFDEKAFRLESLAYMHDEQL